MAKKAYIGVNNFEPVDLPSGYTQVEYIQSSSSGGQYINTGFAPDSNTRIVCTVYGFDTSKGSQFVFGSRVSSSSNSFTLLCTDNQAYRSDFGANQATFNTSVNFSGLMTIDKNKTITTLNGNDTVNNTAQSFTSSLNICLFACNTNGVVGNYAVNIKLYSCKIFDNGALVRNFIPCKNSNGTVGMYDLVNSTFYTNAGTGVFSAGTSTVQSLARQIKRFYAGIDGVARKIKKGYIGIDGVARAFFAVEKKLITEIITTSKSWVCPSGVTSINVRLFGGGSSGNSGYYSSDINAYGGCGGCGGRMNTGALSVVPGTSYPVTIGRGGTPGRNGGTTSFGTLLSAPGGGTSSGGSGGGAGSAEAYGMTENGLNATYGGAGGGGAHFNGGSDEPSRGGDNTDYGYDGGAGARNGAEKRGGGGAGSGGNGRAATSSKAGSGGTGRSGALGGTSSGYGGAGGGGYGAGADGGNGGSAGGGGGGYSAPGGKGGSNGGGGGGGYGPDGAGGAGGSRAGSDGGIAAGGGGGGYTASTDYDGGNGGNGICIITYYMEVVE